MRRLHDLDAKDREILHLLEEDGRRSNSDIARLTNLSAPTVAERIARLRDIGVIRGFSVKIDPARVGLPIAAIIEFKPHSNDHDHAVATIASFGAVRDCFKVTGQALLVLIVRVPDNDSLNRMLEELSHHGETKTSIILTTEFKDRPLFDRPLENLAP
jgi:Lrp/AsnC family leucine-responsive transcriptional regulator